MFPLDPIPRLIPAGEWEPLAAGLGQRARALGAFIADAYGEREIVAAGVMPERVIETADNFEPWMLGVEITPEAFVTGLDLVRDGRRAARARGQHAHAIGDGLRGGRAGRRGGAAALPATEC